MSGRTILKNFVNKIWKFTLVGLAATSLGVENKALAQERLLRERLPSPVETDLPVPPRLFLDAAELSETRAAIAIPGSHHQVAFATIRARVDQNDWRVYDSHLNDGNWNYARAWLAREASFLYLITGEQSYAQIAFDALYAIHTDPDPDGRVPETNYGLSRAATGMGFALAYDWAANGWTQAQKAYIQDKILTALDAWTTYDHANFVAPFGSNWVAVCRGAELVMMLAVGEEVNRSDRFNALKFWLGEHITTAYGNTGLTQEGQGYLAYAGGFLMPAVYALRSIGDMALESALRTVNFEQLLLYGGVFNAAQTSLQFGVGGEGFDAEGFSSFLLDYASPDLQPYYQYFYDRYRGLANPAPDGEKFDHRRAGTVWSILYYPTDSDALNPTGVLPTAIQDREQGSYLFRNRWRNANDILISLMGDFAHHRRSWDQPETFGLGIYAYDTRYFGGPSQAREPQYFSKLLIDGQVGNSVDVGMAEFFEVRETGGYAIVDGGSAYGELGIDQAKRHLLVNFSESVNPSENADSALISVLDRLSAVESHVYTWQANLGSVVDDGGITLTTEQEGTVKTFLLEGNNDSYLKGWILNPTNVTLRAGDPLQIETTGNTADIWIVMLVSRGNPPTARISGTGLRTEFSLGNVRVYFDGERNRIMTETDFFMPVYLRS